MARITVTITPEEKAALITYARKEMRRDPRDQAAIILRQHLEQAGYLPPAQPKPQPPAEPPRP